MSYLILQLKFENLDNFFEINKYRVNTFSFLFVFTSNSQHGKDVIIRLCFFGEAQLVGRVRAVLAPEASEPVEKNCREELPNDTAHCYCPIVIRIIFTTLFVKWRDDTGIPGVTAII